MDNFIKDLQQVSIEYLKDDLSIGRIEEHAADSQFESEPMAAREFYEVLDELMKKYGGQLNGTKEYVRLFAVLQKLLWHALPALDKKIKQQMLGSNVLFSIKNNIDILADLDAYLYLFEFGVGPDNEERQMFMYSLTHNQERLGNELIILKSGESVPPFVSNWIKDFTSYTDADTAIKGESYELTQYMYSSPNAKKLNNNDKQVLAYVINVYNHLRYPKYIPEIEKPTPEPANKPAPKPISQPVAKPVIPQFKAPIVPPSVPKLVVPPPVIKPTPPKPNPVVSEIKREVATPELPAHSELPKTSVITNRPANIPPTKISGTTLDQVKTVDDLKKISIDQLRQGPIATQTQLIKSKIISIASANRMLPYFAVVAFEASPLFQAYLQEGGSKMGGGGKDSELSKEEFEAIADLRKQIENL